jgi:hypothetical protein
VAFILHFGLQGVNLAIGPARLGDGVHVRQAQGDVAEVRRAGPEGG